MLLNNNNLHIKILSSPRLVKKFFLLFLDSVALLLSVYTSIALSLGDLFPSDVLSKSFALFLLIPLAGAIIFTKLGMYRAVVRYMNIKLLQSVAFGVMLLTIVFSFTVLLLNIEGVFLRSLRTSPWHLRLTVKFIIKACFRRPSGLSRESTTLKMDLTVSPAGRDL
ncbi:hypothetical protein XMM312_000030 [Marinobacterium sp. xm-m-312]|nr:hypothetical protein [Marinobacterium sp. xm-m-312]